MGQNFLVDDNIARKIVATLNASKTDPVIEIGPGRGALTRHLLENYEDFTAIELDKDLSKLLQKTYPGIGLIEGDVLGLDWARLQEGKSPVHVIGNLPYYITSPILFRLIEARNSIAEAVVMVQAEVATRLVAEPGSRQYGRLSVMVQSAVGVEHCFRVPSTVFRPRPRVDSAVVRLDFSRSSRLPEEIPDDLFARIVKEAFSQRRKKLSNSLGRVATELGVEIPPAIADRRADDLSVDDYLMVAKTLSAR